MQLEPQRMHGEQVAVRSATRSGITATSSVCASKSTIWPKLVIATLMFCVRPIPRIVGNYAGVRSGIAGNDETHIGQSQTAQSPARQIPGWALLEADGLSTDYPA